MMNYRKIDNLRHFMRKRRGIEIEEKGKLSLEGVPVRKRRMTNQYPPRDLLSTTYDGDREKERPDTVHNNQYFN